MSKLRFILATALALATGPVSGAVVDGAAVSYTALNKKQLPMRQFNGKYTSMLVQQAVLDTMGTARIRKLIDEHDIIFATYKSLGAQVPAPGGTVSIAIVPMNWNPTCQPGCTGGNGMVEITPDVLNDPMYGNISIHEIGHAFGYYSDFLFGGSDGSHCWTSVYDNYIKLYLGLSNDDPEVGLNASDYFKWRLRKVFGPYQNHPGASWSQCVRDGLCDPVGIVDPVYMTFSAQAGIVLKLADYYGTRSLTGWLPNVKLLLAQSPNPPANDLEKEELLVESLGKTLAVNVACVFDQLQWPVGTALRSRLAQYGAPSALCSDADGDGYTGLKNDCNDASASVHPDAVEIVNGADEDCDGIKDNTLIQETTGFPNFAAQALPIPVPVKIKGAVTTTDIEGGWDCFELNLAAPDSLRFTLNSPGSFYGWISWRSSEAGNPETGAHVMYPGDIASLKRGIPAGKSVVCISANEVPGAYEMDISRAYAYPMAPDITPVTFTPAKAGATLAGKILLPVPAIPPALTGQPGLISRYWVSGTGDVGSIASTSASPFIWTPPAGSNQAGAAYRVNFVSSGLPVHPWSQHQSLLGPMGWSSQDIGTVGFAGAYTKFGEQNLTVQASGADIWGTVDGFRFTSLPVTGNSEVVAKIQTLSLSNAAVKGGVMIRETLGATSKNVFVGLQGATQATFQARTATGGSTTNTKRAGAAPLWVKLGRAGDVFSAYTSLDGVAWSQLGVPVTIPMAASTYAGLALTSHTNATSAIAGFSNVKVTSASTLPSPWITGNIGSVGVAGEASMVGGVLTASGSGADIWGTADAFRYVYFPVVGNAQLTAQLTSLQNTNAWAKAGVMIRATESAGSSNGFMALTPSNGAVFQTRSALGAVTTSVKAAGAVPKWVRITRVANLISGFVSDNGTAWTLVGASSVSMSGTILVGVAVASHNNTSAAKVVVQGLNPN